MKAQDESKPAEDARRSAEVDGYELPEKWRVELGAVDETTVLIMAWLALLVRRVHEAYQANLRAFGLSYSEYAALHTLRIGGPPHRMSPSRLNDILALSSGGVTKTIDRLESAGLVKRMPDPSDGRGVLVALTARGRKTATRIFDKGLESHEAILHPLSRRDRRRLLESLRTLLDAFEGLPSRSAKGSSR